MPIKDTIEKLDELREKANLGLGYITQEGSVRDEYFVALHNSYESLRKAALAGQALLEAVEVNSCCHVTREYCECLKKRDAALATYRKAIEQVPNTNPLNRKKV